MGKSMFTPANLFVLPMFLSCANYCSQLAPNTCASMLERTTAVSIQRVAVTSLSDLVLHTILMAYCIFGSTCCDGTSHGALDQQEVRQVLLESERSLPATPWVSCTNLAAHL
eukprot:676626-Amphidinium_carterae.1